MEKVLVLMRRRIPQEGTQYKRPYRDVPQTWVPKSASWFINDPFFYAKFGMNGLIFTIFSNLKKIGKKNQVILVIIWLKLGQWVYERVTFSSIYYMYGSLFSNSLPKNETPLQLLPILFLLSVPTTPNPYHSSTSTNQYYFYYRYCI